MSATKVASSSTSLAVVSPSLVEPSPHRIVPTDQDVLCGRGKGIRKHPGNELYNKLLRDNYDEYKSAPKGSKVSIVKKIVSLVRERGRFLERTKNNEGKWVYTDIGDERAMNKTAQAFRDIRVTMEKHDRPISSTTIKKAAETPRVSPLFLKGPRRPTFRERLAMLEREQRRRNGESNSSDEDDDESANGSEEEDEEVSDTETEDSFSTDR